MLKIDSHQHLWQYDPAEYGWITEAMSVLKRNFLPSDLRLEMEDTGVSGAISVQASQTVAETRWLLKQAEENEFIKGVVGWVPLIDPKVGGVLEDLAAEKKLVGIRHVLQDEADPLYMLREDFNRGIQRLRQLHLPYDILIYERHLPQTIEFVDRHPDQVFIVDHLAKPKVGGGELSPWREHLEELARRPRVYCKLSGLVTEGNHGQWTAEQLKPYIETILSAFGPQRILFGTDWPVCLLACGYKQWIDIVTDAVGPLSRDEQQRIWAGTTIEAYGVT